MAKSKIVFVRGRKHWRAARELKPTWKDRELELSSAEIGFNASAVYFQKTVTEMRDAAADVSRAVKRLTEARTAMLRKRR